MGGQEQASSQQLQAFGRSRGLLSLVNIITWKRGFSPLYHMGVFLRLARSTSD